ncbi:MAG: FAD-binding oxidoreductase [Chloroflexota bacterium]
MKRWNGWGEETTDYPLPESAAHFLARRLGPGLAARDAELSDVLAGVPPSRLPSHPLLDPDPEVRLRHARGQSLPDWIALRSGRIGAFPDAVAFPTSDEDVHALFDLCRVTRAHLIPFGGGTSVVGHINPTVDDIPTISADLSRLHHLLDLDEVSHLATFEAGVRGPDLEAQLNARGYTLGHYPQSFEFSTLGGWIATRSSGQQSYYYGRIEDHFAGGHVETPIGPLDLPPVPASAAGPDLRHLILGSEGRLGVITRAVIRIRPLPQTEGFYAIFFHDWEAGTAAVREIAQRPLSVSMLRLSDAQETETTLALSGRERLVTWADRGLRTLSYGPQRCLLIYGVTGTRPAAARARREAEALARRHDGLPVGSWIGHLWHKSRFLTPYLRNTLWERGYAIDTLETAVPWSRVLPTAAAIKAALNACLDPLDERTLAFAHLSHVYRDGASIYLTYLFRRTADPDETLQRWQTLKGAACRVIVEHGGTISHQHGVGLDHRAYLEHEKGAVGLELLRAACRASDPHGLLNPGKLLPDAE